MNNQLPAPWATTVLPEYRPGSTGPNFRAMTRDQIEAWKLDGLRATALRAFHERRKFPLGSPERTGRFQMVQAARKGYRAIVDQRDMEHCTFAFERQAAEQIEAIAAERGIPVSALLMEVMRTALWRFGIKDGIRSVSATLGDDTPDASPLAGAALARQDAAEPETSFLTRQAQATVFAFDILREVERELIEDESGIADTIPETVMDTLTTAIRATAAAVKALRQIDGPGIEPQPVTGGDSAEVQVAMHTHTKEAFCRVSSYRNGRMTGRVDLPADTLTVAEVDGIVSQLLRLSGAS
ncbi:hypothetical protein [Novosphingobium sp. FKTRR1]|uniref:hypothetical protein n=1 Tax=Novosphingobium sp. FKTRR1 TaxID=2879118 RepID=UPI001CF07A0C|nr:hypothetical protein [Novosphingobium sp. FKTRR1]